MFFFIISLTGSILGIIDNISMLVTGWNWIHNQKFVGLVLKNYIFENKHVLLLWFFFFKKYKKN